MRAFALAAGLSLALAGGAALAQGKDGAAPAGPNVTAPARYATVDLRAGFLPDPREVRVEAGGELDAATLGGDCVGWIDATRADVTLNYTAGNFPLIFLAESRADTTLAVRAPDGTWLCNDDFQGLNPGIVIQRPASGEYRVWIGTYNQGRPEPAVLRITEIMPGRPGMPGAGAGAGPNIEAPARYATVNLRAGFLPDPHEVRVEAGGELDARAARLGPSCVGWIDATRADVTLNYTAGNFPLIFLGQSNTDTTLVIRAPDGSWLCNDDFQGLNPGVVIQRPQSGEYRVWIGTFSRGRPTPAVLRITEIMPGRR
jgi:large exoprotein involved in heme utilization and adhesion